jgi:hypothetical protein
MGVLRPRAYHDQFVDAGQAKLSHLILQNHDDRAVLVPAPQYLGLVIKGDFCLWPPASLCQACKHLPTSSLGPYIGSISTHTPVSPL